MAESITSVLATTRAVLKDIDSDNYRWSEDELITHINHVLYDISQSRPRELKSVLSLVDASREVDMSVLEDRIRVRKVEYQVDQDPREYRNLSEWGDELTIDIDTTPTVTEDTLTGTVTFTNDSKAVTGVATAFSTEVEADEFIKKSTDSKWYKVASITSDTALVLVDAYDGTTGADTISVTPLRDYASVVRLYWEALHSISTTTCTVPTYLTGLLVDGAVAYSIVSFANEIGVQVKKAIDTITDIHTSVDNMTARITQAITDLTTGRASIGVKFTEAITAMDDVSARIAQALTDLTAGRALINKVNVGGAPEGDYGNYAARELSNANTYIGQARSYLASDVKSTPYANYAAQELSNATAYLNQAGGYIRELTARLSISNLIGSYQRLADTKFAKYLSDLRRIRRLHSHKDYPSA